MKSIEEIEPTEDNIKKMLQRYTDDFSSEDISFIIDLQYPVPVKIYNTNVDPLNNEDDEPPVVSRLVDDFTGLNELLITFREDTMIEINQVMGKMSLQSRVDK